MAGIKRKEAPVSKANGFDKNKKAKVDQKARKKPAPPAKDLETATDSDPIVESDTTGHSGDDDGESWPSDNEETGEPVAAKLDRKEIGNPPRSGGEIDGAVLSNGKLTRLSYGA